MDYKELELVIEIEKNIRQECGGNKYFIGDERITRMAVRRLQRIKEEILSYEKEQNDNRT